MSQPLNISNSIHIPGGPCPGDIEAWLHSRGWNSSYSGTGKEWTRGTYYSLSWEQAVAVEFYLYCSLGGVHGPREG